MALTPTATRKDDSHDTSVTRRGPRQAPTPQHPVMMLVEQQVPGNTCWELSGDMVVGRASRCTISLDDDAVSRQHACVRCGEPTNGRIPVTIEDLGSLNGTLVNDVVVGGRFELREHDRVRVGNSVLKLVYRDEDELAAERYLRALATRDSLTGLLNRGNFDARLTQEIERARRHGSRVTLLLLDIDHFKRVNDTYGHPAGDAVLKAVAAAIAANLRGCDHAARYGGEEFAVILPETDVEGAWRTAERLRQAVAATPITFEGQTIRVTVSVGGAELGVGDAGVLIRDADAALYRAKQAGRDRVETTRSTTT